MAATTLLHTWRQPLLHLGSRCTKSLPAFGHGRRTALLLRVLHERRANPFYDVSSNWHITRASRLCTAATSNSSNSSSILSKPAKKDMWAEPELWVVFSDLHLSRRTCDICLQVLQTVHAEALARNAGIIFLGDFWHSRGALPVELLNVAIMELQSWQCPAIFIPGNHDQVNLGGQVHALQVLEAANPYIKVLSDPVEYLGALWMPFRRDHSLIEQAIQQCGPINAIFAHLDVVGAFLNEASQAKEGIEPSVFPQNLPVYTGHYHKPHVVKGTQIEYVGSPYQVSAGESGQIKHFLLLDKSWQKIGEIPLSIGPRHFIISQDENLPLDHINNFQEGDRVRWHLQSSTLDDSVKLQVERLQTRGVLVDLVFPIVAFKQRIKEAENLDAFGLFELYAQSVEMNDNVTKMATDMLRSLNFPAKLIEKPQVHCELESVELEGFGTFLGVVKYPLVERGVRIVSGKNMDSMGADSNGAGKTTLVMAPLWALTDLMDLTRVMGPGSTDARPDSARGLTAGEVVHHAAKRARVRVDGTINGKSFTVERTAGRRSSLKFILDGEDQTCQEIRMTQSRIDELLDTSVLYRTVFQGQHGGGGLLEASDKDFKEELSRFVAMEVWETAKEHSSKELRKKRIEIENLEGALQELVRQYQHLKSKVDASIQQSQEWEMNRSKRGAISESELSTAEATLLNTNPSFAQTYVLVSSTKTAWETLGEELEMALKNGVDSWSPPRKCPEDLKTSMYEGFEDLLQRQSQISHQVKLAEALIMKRKQMVEAFKKNVAGAIVCDKCLQPINAMHSSQSLVQLEGELTSAVEEHNHFVKELKKTENEVKCVRDTIEHERQAMETETLKLKHAQEAFKQESAKFLFQLNRIRQCTALAQMVLSSAATLLPGTEEEISTCSSSSTRKPVEVLSNSEDFKIHEQNFVHQIRQLEADVRARLSLKNRVEQLKVKCQAVKMEKNPFQAEYEILSTLCEKANIENQEKQSLSGHLLEEAGWLKEIDTAFGLTGVQSYILEGALADVQERTARYLEMLSGGSLGLLLRPTKLTKGSKVSVEAIDKIAVVRLSNGTLENRSLRQLSGGERRRMALSLALGYSEFVSQRGGVHCNVLVLDEVLQHLDGEGQARVVALLKSLPQSTVLVVSQAHSLLAGTFDLVDWVIKQQDSARVEVAEEVIRKRCS